MRLVPVVALLAGCLMEHKVVVDGISLQQNATDLQAKGSAYVAVDESRSADFGYDEHVSKSEAIGIDQEVTDNMGRTRWVRDLLRGCSATDFSEAANPDCELTKLGSSYQLRSWETRNTTMFFQLSLVGLTVGALGAAGICLEACSDDSGWHDASKYTLAGAGTLLAGTLVWAILDCMGKWGEPGCRD